MRFYHKESHDEPVGGWYKTFVLQRLSFILRLRKRTDPGVGEGSVVQEYVEAEDSKITTEDEQEKGVDSLGGFIKGGGGCRQPLLELERKLDVIVRSMKEREESDARVDEWHIVGRTLDRLACIIFLVGFVLNVLFCICVE